MINIAICDDDKKIVDEIKECIHEYEPKNHDICTYSCGEHLLLDKKKFHLIFLDIDMGELDGIETAKRIRKYDKDVKIVYVTNFTEYINRAFEVHAFGYLNKPIKKEQIYKQLNEAEAYSKENELNKLIEFITTEGIVRLYPEDIYYFEYIDRKVKIKTLNRSYIIKQKITSIAANMMEYGFLMPHKSFTVNLFHVKAIKGYNIFMMDGSVVPLSQKKSAEFREKFNIYLENHIFSM
ncbi:LytR/AlgR family response regulator transcription factor [Clostridium oryzae]|uniref:Stage 0 sporulation protein A homolog n=1 Tax=Clostridium oryzae TaxID=1450648 RepID=A0A1V4IMA0_9CLOT|nr:LytTR family DNA-binding domain-containing protein [Clostridium oryzae]OPJ60950.1 transcriptional regulatory protein YpdB [Clostridium oryzae]